MILASFYLQTVTFVKKHHWTTLLVKFRGTLRAGFGAASQPNGEWRILFNGAECGSPGNIDSGNYNYHTNTDHHIASGSKLLNYLNILTVSGFIVCLNKVFKFENKHN